MCVCVYLWVCVRIIYKFSHMCACKSTCVPRASDVYVSSVCVRVCFRDVPGGCTYIRVLALLVRMHVG